MSLLSYIVSLCVTSVPPYLYDGDVDKEAKFGETVDLECVFRGDANPHRHMAQGRGGGKGESGYRGEPGSKGCGGDEDKVVVPVLRCQ